MTLYTHCTSCHQPLSIPLPDCTDEQEAQTISQSVLCQPCTLSTANGQAAIPDRQGESGGVQLKASANRSQSAAVGRVVGGLEV